MLEVVFMNRIATKVIILAVGLLLYGNAISKQRITINDEGVGNKCSRVVIDTFYLHVYTVGESKDVEIAYKKALLDIERVFINQLYMNLKVFYESYTDGMMLVSNESLKQLAHKLLYANDISIVCKDTVVEKRNTTIHIAAVIERNEIIERFTKLSTNPEELPEGILQKDIVAIIENLKE